MNKYENNGRKIQKILDEYLVSEGWKVEINRKDQRGIDIEANRDNEKWIIRAVGAEAGSAEPGCSFVSVLGEILQRMDDEKARYSIGVPDKQPYRRFWERLPQMPKKRTGITILFIKSDRITSG